MNKSTAVALYGLSIDCFLEGLAAEVPKPQEFQLTEAEAVQVRRDRYKDKIVRIRERKAA